LRPHAFEIGVAKLRAIGIVDRTDLGIRRRGDFAVDLAFEKIFGGQSPLL